MLLVIVGLQRQWMKNSQIKSQQFPFKTSNYHVQEWSSTFNLFQFTILINVYRQATLDYYCLCENFDDLKERNKCFFFAVFLNGCRQTEVSKIYPKEDGARVKL